MILVLAGPNGSGKSTITTFYDKVRKYTNADDIVATTRMNNIKELLDICDIMHVYDNTKSPERIICKHKEELSIYPNEYWREQDILGLME